MLLKIWDALVFGLYFLLTMEDRQAYLQGLEKGAYAEGVRNGIVKYDTSRRPMRNYLTWPEFRNSRHARRNKANR